MKVLVTGAAGFIGSHVARRLVEKGRCEALGVDNLDAYYDVNLKRARLKELESFDGFRFVRMDFADAEKFAALVAQFKPDYVAHFGAQAGVRHSLENPGAYVHSNLDGFASVLEACRRTPPRHLLYASSSSVYGAGAAVPFREDDDTGQPVSFYGATKKCNEIMAQSYARSHGLRITGVRLFSVYGPWGRPDMSPTLFAKAITEGRPIPLFNEGKNRRDFTYIDDIVDGALKILLYPPSPETPECSPLREERNPPRLDCSPVREDRDSPIFNLGHSRPLETLFFVRILEEVLGRKAQVELLPPQPGEMTETCADLTRVQAAYGFKPSVPLEEGLKRFADWFRGYYDVAPASRS